MYIPHAHHSRSDFPHAPQQTFGTGYEQLHRPIEKEVTDYSSGSTWSSLSQLLSLIAAPLRGDSPSAGIGVRKRATAADDTDTTIGIVVGVLLGVFVVATIAFLYVYRNSIRFKGRKRRHRKSSSKSSKSSKSSDGGGAPSAPAATPAA